jgi:uncharacterized damage-inducible protein DinB
MVRLEQVLDSWKTVRKDTAQAVLDMPADGFAFSPTPDMMSFDQIARHVLNSSRSLVLALLAGTPDFSAPGVRESFKQLVPPLPETATAAEISAELTAWLDRDCDALAAMPAGFYSEIIKRLDGQPVTRLEMLQFVKEHEITHRSQMFVYLRLKGVVPPTTRRRLAKK